MQIRHVAAVALVASSLSWSQSSFTAAVRGVVADRTGAAVVGARIAVTESERNVRHAVVSDAAGRFAVTALPPGRYLLTVEAPGFKKYAQPDIPIDVRPWRRSVAAPTRPRGIALPPLVRPAGVPLGVAP